jgi:large subunit ribosomal protein L17
MRHGKKFNHLSRKTAHRKSLLSNMACSLIEHKKINTTLAKAKALRKYVEPLITKSKTDTTHSRRVVFSYLKQKEAVSELFREVASKVADRPGGYTRIIKLNPRLGDNAEMAIIELVDYNELMLSDKTSKTKKTRRRRTKKTTTDVAEVVSSTESTDQTATDAEVIEDVVEETKAKVEKATDAEVVDSTETTDQTVTDEEVIEDVVEETKAKVEKATDEESKEEDSKSDSENDKKE